MLHYVGDTTRANGALLPAFRGATLAVELLSAMYMTRHLLSAMLAGVLAVPATALAQHSAPAGASSAGTAAPVSAPSSSSGGGSSSAGPSSSGGGSSGGFFGPRQNAATGVAATYGRRRGDVPATGTAVRRGPTATGGTAVVLGGGGFYPWGYGFGGDFLGGYFDGYYSGYYGAYDPWYGWFPTYAPVTADGSEDTGAIRLRVKPSDASVYVDGYYVGVVDDFDNPFQRLTLEPGPHRLEIRGQGLQPLSLDVMIQEGTTITYLGALKK